ncbi:MAG: substrate-binding domain-containing protein [Hyphomicrobiaceae bacterium]|nr:substrate-binding domain-containing protein [Hyphomicrobiaceae bacterium]MCC0007580.1 substrate-binding domain-containing protein [Hyphomicrobiaceae bacterium]
MWSSGRRSLLAIVVAMGWATSCSSIALADEATLRFKGGGFEVTGEVKSYDGSRYIIESKALGTMTLEADRFDCVSGACPTEPMTAAAAPVKAGPIGNLGTTNWEGGSGIGTDYMPQLVKAYAASRGLTVERAIGADERDIEFKLLAADGRAVGQFNVRRRGVSSGYAELARGGVDLVWTSARMTDAQAQSIAAAGVPDLRVNGSEHVFALDSMVVLVANDNPAVSISEENVAKIYSGEISDWSQLGLPAGKINVYAPVDGMGLLMHFKNTVLEPRKLKVRDDAQRLGTVVEWSDKVAADPMGISFNFIGYIRNARALNIETPCGLVSVPTTFSTKTEEFPMARRLYFYTRARPKTPLAQELLDFALSAEGQEVLKSANFVDQSPELLEFREQGTRIAYALNVPAEDFDFALMRQLITDLTDARRLTTTFRFESSSFRLDTKANQDISRLAAFLNQEGNRDKRVLLLGFADSRGDFQKNQALARARADTIRKGLVAINKQFNDRVEAKGYSELAPVACNDSIIGQEFNRRVEVWLR